ncbi:unnamed protein product [Macrosiphum euphorbiae]|uniref:SWIM-type domain-containing protein n=2 Tax=Macrosiphum euphorbiae TaxID=13131 RepID=A0AAV0WA42_9HEMI|nr:unnamed protein product [Macrosiphum euphorbiae]
MYILDMLQLRTSIMKKKINKIKLDQLLFEVKSEIDSTLYMVNFQLPSCTCLDFNKYHWPCKHICALFIYVPGCSFEDLPQIFQNNVFISPDPRYSITNNTDQLIINKVTVLNEKNENVTINTSVNPSSDLELTTSGNISNIPAQCRELLKKNDRFNLHHRRKSTSRMVKRTRYFK